MALYPAFGGGGTYKETLLWTNSSSTATFAAQIVALSDNIDNYDYIGVYWYYPSNYTGEPICTFMKVSDFKKTGNANLSMALSLGFKSTAGTIGTRNTYYVSDTSIGFTDCRTGTTTTNNGTIPQKIVGLK